MKKSERINQWEEKIKKIVLGHKQLDDCCNAAYDIGTLNVDGKLSNAIWVMYDTLLGLIDESEWISWYVYENGCGEKKMEAGYDGKLDEITTPRQLAELIVKGEDIRKQETKS
jgi:hypothetical protein